MAAGNWIVFNAAKTKLANGGLDLDTDTLKMALFRTSAAVARTSSIWSQLASEVSALGGYSVQGKTLAGCSVKAGGSAGVTVFTHTAKVFSANGASLKNVRYAVIVDTTKGASAGNRPLVCFCALSSAQFGVTTGNTLTVSPPAGGVFDITGATA